MRFYEDGFAPGDPRIRPAAAGALDRPADLPDEIDVLVVGAGPAGLILTAQLSEFPSVSTRLIDRRSAPLETGQADGVQSRTVETFQAFGFAERIVAEAYRITAMAFWRPDPDDPKRIVRTALLPDDPHELSEFPHIVINQARVQDYFLEFMATSPARTVPDYGIEFLGLRRLDREDYPVEVRLRHTTGPFKDLERTIRARYLVGCDGARSAVRDAIGRRLVGDQAMHAWGVMDLLGDSDFPDFRLKSAIQSHDGGSILHIPREGGHLFRLYVDLGDVTADDARDIRKTTVEEMVDRANQIMYPYTVAVKSVVWQSVYEVAHRLTDRFDDGSDEGKSRAPRIFIAGDACHTHSAKAAQGMNVSMQDGFNLGWKLGHVLDGRSSEELLRTYSTERQAVATDLIEFDKGWSRLMAAAPAQLDAPSEVEDFFLKTFDFTTGFMTEYQRSPLTAGPEHQGLATGFPLGRRFKSAPVIRVCDLNPLQLGHQARADGRWRIYVFVDRAACDADSSLGDLASWLANSPDSPLLAGGDDDPGWVTRFDLKVVFQQEASDVDLALVPDLFRPRVGSLQLVNYENVFAADPASDIFELRSVDRDGALVIVRPDQYVSNVLPLTATTELAEFFKPLLLGDRLASRAA
jgi:phenol 2-monooxygenase